MATDNTNSIHNGEITVDEYIKFLKNKLMNEQIKHYIQDEEIACTEFMKILGVLKDHRIAYTLTEECYDKKITVNLYVCKNTIVEVAKVIRELESQIK